MSRADALHRLADVSSLLGDLLAERRGLREFLAGLTALGAGSVSGSTSCSIRLARPRGREIRAHTDHRAEVCAHAEWQHGEGPGDLAMVLGGAVLVDDQSLDERWADYRASALAEGVVSSMSVPLTSAGRQLGVVTLYAVEHRDPDARGLEELRRFADTAGDALGFVGLLAPAGLPGATDVRPGTGQATVERAVGVLVGLRGESTASARAELRARAALASGSVHAVAVGVIEDAAAGPPPDDATAFGWA